MHLGSLNRRNFFFFVSNHPCTTAVLAQAFWIAGEHRTPRITVRGRKNMAIVVQTRTTAPSMPPGVINH